MPNIINTLKQIEDLFQGITMQILGIDPAIAVNQNKVRIAWPVGGAPAWKITEDIIFVRVTSNNDPIIQQRDIEYTPYDTNNSNRKASYTRNHTVQWTCYGPNSFDNVDKIRNGIFLLANKETFDINNLALVTDVSAPTRAPELFNGQWWDRSDVQANFNESVTRTGTVPYIQEVIVGTEVQIKKG